MIKSKSYSVDEALQKMKAYCAYQERCHKEVLEKLKSMRMIPEAIDHIMSRLIKDNYLNETRFAKTYVRGKFRIKNWGRKRLTLELKKRDISKFNIKAALDEIEDQEYIEIFNALAEKRFTNLKSGTKQAKKRKLVNYLLYRGWESHLVYQKVHELIR